MSQPDPSPSATAARVLLIEDGVDLHASLAGDLRAGGFDVFSAADGTSGLTAAQVYVPDVMVLNLDVPDLDARAVLIRLRRVSSVPVLVISERAAPEDKVRALQWGANDYLVKPFAVPELLARLHAQVRRAGGRTLRYGEVRVSLEGRLAWFRGVELELSATEFKLLTALVEHNGQVMTREQLARVARPDGSCTPSALNVHISNLKRKLWAAGGHWVLRTVRGVGYHL